MSRHGDVVDALHAWRTRSDARATIGQKHAYRLGLEHKGGLTELCEVKTSTARGDVYTAIGQLTVHAKGDDCKRFVVLPQREALAKEDLKDGLARSGIELLRFELTETEAKIL